MNNLAISRQLVLCTLILLLGQSLQAQQEKNENYRKTREEAELERTAVFEQTIALVNNRQFVFQAEFGQNSEQVFVVVDTTYGEVQNGIRNNLDGTITKWLLKINDRKKTLSLTLKIRSALSTADVFLLIGESGNGTATIRRDNWGEGSTHSAALNAEYTRGFTFNGKLVDFENCTIYEGKSHLVH